jgi:hypothetical protein
MVLWMSSHNPYGKWSIFRDRLTTSVDGYKFPILFEYWYNINSILVKWYFYLSCRLKYSLVLPKFHLKIHLKMIACLFVCWIIKFISGFLYRHTYAIIIIRVILVWKILTLLVVPQSTQPFQISMTWVIHNICCDFKFDSENKIYCIFESIKFIWSANDLNMVT